MSKIRRAKERLDTLKSEITKEKATSVLRSVVVFEKELLVATVAGLRSIAAEIRKPFQVLLGHLNLSQLVFLAVCLGCLVTGLLPWIQYRVVFQSEEIVNVGSTTKVLFVLPALAGIILSALEIRQRRLVLLVLCGVAGMAFVGGIIFPNPVHTSIVPGEFHLRWVAYTYVPFLALVAYSSEKAFEKTTFPAAEMLHSMLAADRPVPAGMMPARPRSGRAG